MEGVVYPNERAEHYTYGGLWWLVAVDGRSQAYMDATDGEQITYVLRAY